MKSFYCSIFLLCIVSCYGQAKKLQKGESKITNNYKDYYINSTEYQGNYDFINDDYYEGEYVGNPDFDAEIERPCQVFDLNCIRRYFADHSRCKIRRGPLPRNLFISQEAVYFSRENITATVNNDAMTGFRSTRIEEFYINRRTNKMVFSINIRGYARILPSAYFSFYRNAREPIVIVTNLVVYFPSLTYTAIIPNINDLQLEKIEITSYVDILPAMFLGPELFSSTDPVVIQSVAELLADVPTEVQEVMLTDAILFPPAYIHYNICDFGLKTLPVDLK